MTWAAVYPKSSEPVTHYYHAHQVWAWKGGLGSWLNGLVELGSVWWWFLSSLVGFDGLDLDLL